MPLFIDSKSGISWGGRAADGAIGFGGGILGGLAGLSGPLPTVWADIRGWTKVQSRSVFQVYNLAILSAVVVAHAVAGFVTPELLLAAAIALPASMVGSWIGFAVYGRLSDWALQAGHFGVVVRLWCNSRPDEHLEPLRLSWNLPARFPGLPRDHDTSARRTWRWLLGTGERAGAVIAPIAAMLRPARLPRCCAETE